MTQQTDAETETHGGATSRGGQTTRRSSAQPTGRASTARTRRSSSVTGGNVTRRTSATDGGVTRRTSATVGGRGFGWRGRGGGGDEEVVVAGSVDGNENAKGSSVAGDVEIEAQGGRDEGDGDDDEEDEWDAEEIRQSKAVPPSLLFPKLELPVFIFISIGIVNSVSKLLKELIREGT